MADIWANSMACHPRVRCCHLANSVSWSHSYVSHCRVLQPGEFNGMSSQSYVSQCRVLPLSEFTVMFPEPHATLQGAVTWRNQCHDRATLQGVRIPSAILNIVFRHIFCFQCSLGFDERRLSYRLGYSCLNKRCVSLPFCKFLVVQQCSCTSVKSLYTRYVCTWYVDIYSDIKSDMFMTLVASSRRQTVVWRRERGRHVSASVDFVSSCHSESRTNSPHDSGAVASTQHSVHGDTEIPTAGLTNVVPCSVKLVRANQSTKDTIAGLLEKIAGN